MKIQCSKGFIQAPILLAVIIGLVIFSGISYAGITRYKSHQAEKEKQAQESLLAQQKALEETKKEIEESKQQLEDKIKQQEEKIDSKTDKIIANLQNDNTSLKNRVDVLQDQVQIQEQKSSSNDSQNITVDDIQPFLLYVVRISCNNWSTKESGWGSGFIFNDDDTVKVLTNRHVVVGSYDSCSAHFENNLEKMYVYGLNRNTAKVWNTATDSIILEMSTKINVLGIEFDRSDEKPVNQIRSSISLFTNRCSKFMPIGSPVAVIGYPVTTTYNNSLDVNGIQIDLPEYPQTYTMGVISAHEKSNLKTLPDYNYFITAQIDNGNSGGLALSKEDGKICLLGLPTWAATGNYQNQGIVQSMNNIVSN